MRIKLTILFVFFYTLCNAQYPITQTLGSDSTLIRTKGGLQGRLIPISYPDTTTANLERINQYPGSIISVGDNLWLRNKIANKWLLIGSDLILSAGAITSLPSIGNNPGTNITTASFILSQFYASQPPTASLSGGVTYEYTTAGNTNRTLNWTAGRQAATSTLSTIIVDGVSQAFTQPALNASVSSTKTAIVPNNTNTTYTNTVTTTDGKTATATTSFYYQNKIYAGFVTSTTPTDADIIAATGSGYVGGTFSATRNQSGNLTTPPTSNYIVFVSPASYGTPNVVINGLGVTYNQTTRSFTNASGGISSYIIAVSPFPTAGQIDSYLIN